jgi:hypothetical protein
VRSTASAATISAYHGSLLLLLRLVLRRLVLLRLILLRLVLLRLILLLLLLLLLLMYEMGGSDGREAHRGTRAKNSREPV